MKLSVKRLFTAGVLLISPLVLAACGASSSNSADEKQVYEYIYSADPENLNYLLNYNGTTTDITTKGVDGLLENDKYGNLIGSLAEDWTVSSDGLTYTYTLREDAYWYTSEGEEYAQVTANDFVTALKYAADNASQSLYIVQNSIAGLNDYVNGTITDFSEVGVKAVDDFTVQYTLAQPESFWNSKTTYSVLFPVNADFLESQGDSFGSADPTTILYNGPFILTNLTAKSAISFEKNENYWDAENVYIDEINYTYNDGSDAATLYKNYSDGIYTAIGLDANSTTYSEAVEQDGDNIIYGLQDGTTYMLNFNLDRAAYNFTAKTSNRQKEDTKKAILNEDFRQAIAFAFDRTSYNAQRVGEEAATYSLRNTMVPPTFVQIGEEDFGTVVEQELQASYGTEWADVDLSDAQDGFYNTTKAAEEFAKAKEALTAEGVTFPIHLDISVDESSAYSVNMAKSLKESIESSLGSDNVVIDINQIDQTDYYNTTYYAATGDQMDWDLHLPGWAPDYTDPGTYLDIYSPSNGSYLLMFGLSSDDTEIFEAVGLDEYDQLIQTASAETDLTARYEAYAKAQAWLTNSALSIPVNSYGGTPTITKVVPYSASYALTGQKGSATFKYTQLQDEAVSADDFYAAREEWLAEKAKSNAEYQESLADHVVD